MRNEERMADLVFVRLLIIESVENAGALLIIYARRSQSAYQYRTLDCHNKLKHMYAFKSNYLTAK